MIRLLETIAMTCTTLVLTGCGGPQSSPDEAHPHDGAGDHQPQQRHHHGHRFENPGDYAGRFESPQRDEWQRPAVVIEAMGLTPSSVVADIGSATGYFPVRIAAVVTEGRVWGVDIEPGMVRYLNERARSEGLDNLFSILGTPDDPLIPEPVDVVLIVNTYHHIDDRADYFRRLSSHLDERGRLVVVDFRMGEIPVGPPEEMRLPPDVVQQELASAGYSLSASDEESLPYQYILVFEQRHDSVPAQEMAPSHGSENNRLE